MDGSYAGSKDFAVGTTSTSGLRLPKGVPYWMVVYSYGTNYLSGISPSETMSLGNAKHTYDNMVGQNGFYIKYKCLRPQEGDNTMSVVLRHKIAQVTTKINSSALSAPNNITSVTSATLIGNNKMQNLICLMALQQIVLHHKMWKLLLVKVLLRNGRLMQFL